MPTNERLDCFNLIFGAHYAKQLVKGRFQELLDATENPDDPLMRDMGQPQRLRLRAVLRLCQLYYPEQRWPPNQITGTGDVVRLLRERTRDQKERIVWLLVLDAANNLQHEVLVQSGGPATAPPPVNALLRHALFKQAERVYLVDYQFVDRIDWTDERRTWCASLQSAFTLIGVELVDCIFMTPNVVVSLREELALAELPEAVKMAA